MKEIVVSEKNVRLILHGFYHDKKQTAKDKEAVGKAADKILPKKSIDKLVKLGVRKITFVSPKYEFNNGKEPTAKLRKEVDKVLTPELVYKLIKIGLWRIKITNLKEFKKIKNAESVFD